MMRWFEDPRIAFGAPALVLGLHLLGLWTDSYAALPHFDSLLHLLGGIACSLTAGWLLLRGAGYRLWSLPSVWLCRVLITGSVALIALGWEVFELLFFPHWQPGVADTVNDQVLGVAGSMITALSFRPRSSARA